MFLKIVKDFELFALNYNVLIMCLNGQKLLEISHMVLYEYFNDHLIISYKRYFNGIIQPESPFVTSPFNLVLLKAIYLNLLAMWQRAGSNDRIQMTE